MSRMSALQAASENSMYLLRWALEDVAQGAFGDGAFFTITRAYRRTGIGALLAEADSAELRAALAKSGQAYVQFLMLVQRGGRTFDPKYYCTSKCDPFCDALVAGDLDTARVIATLSPTTHFPDVEYEDDFLRNHVLHRLLLDPEDRARVDPLLARWEQVLEGGESVWLDVLRALLERDAAVFGEAFDDLIERRGAVLKQWRMMSTFDPAIYATEGRIFITALAILRLAELRGLPTRPDYRFAPDLARIPLGLPLPPPGAWQQP